jgi:hypothetical protein
VWQTFLVDPPKKTGATKIGTAHTGLGAGVWSTPTVDPKRACSHHDGRHHRIPRTRRATRSWRSI